jgi:hypothetical protein
MRNLLTTWAKTIVFKTDPALWYQCHNFPHSLADCANNTVVYSQAAEFHNQEFNNSFPASIVLWNHSLGIRLRILIPIVISFQAWTALPSIYYTPELLISTWWFSLRPFCALLYVIMSFLVWTECWILYTHMRAHVHTHLMNDQLILVTIWLFAVLIKSKAT